MCIFKYTYGILQVLILDDHGVSALQGPPMAALACEQVGDVCRFSGKFHFPCWRTVAFGTSPGPGTTVLCIGGLQADLLERSRGVDAAPGILYKAL